MHFWKSLIATALYLFTYSTIHAQFKSDDLLMDQLLLNLKSKDFTAYSTQFAPFDTIWHVVTKVVPVSPDDAKRIANIKSHPEKIQQFDPAFNKSMETEFKSLMKKGVDSGLHWTEIRLVRFELEKMLLTKDMIGFEKVAPTRLQGYLYVQDMLTSRTFTIALKNVFNINNKWYGGQIVNLLEAENVDEYLDRLAAERKMEKQRLLAEMYGEPEPGEPESTEETEEEEIAKKKQPGERDYLKMDIEEDGEEQPTKGKRPPARKEMKMRLTKVLDRKFFTGYIDKDIKVDLYLRSLQGDCPEPICGWEAMYRVGKDEEFLKLEVVRKPDGKFSMIEEAEEGAMELTLNNGELSGIWQSPQDKTEYEIKMAEQKDMSPKKFYQLDELIESY